MASRPAALLTVFDDDGVISASIPLSVAPVQLFMSEQYGGENRVGFWLGAESGDDIEIRPEWVGKYIEVAVAPSAVSGEEVLSEVARVASEWKAMVA